MNIWFKDIWTTLSTIFLLIMIAYIVMTLIKHKEIKNWGKRVSILMGIGLLLCIFVVMRDGYVASIQGGIGLFAMNSIQVYLAYLGAGIIGICGILTLIIPHQKYRKILFMMLSFAILFKATIIEISRIFM